MNLNLQDVLKTASMIGAELPAYEALFNQIIDLFSNADQDTLRARYEAAKADSDAAHKRAQED